MAKAKAKKKLLIERGWQWIETDEGRDIFIGQFYDRKIHAESCDGPRSPDFRLVQVEVRELPARRKAKQR